MCPSSLLSHHLHPRQSRCTNLLLQWTPIVVLGRSLSFPRQHRPIYHSFLIPFLTSFSHIMPPRSVSLINTSSSTLRWPWRFALILSLFPLLASIGFVLFPTVSTTAAGFPVASSAGYESYVLLLSAREAFIGLVGIVLWWRGEVRALGWVLLLLGVVPAVDGWVALQSGVTALQALGHWGTIAVCAAVGYTLINA